MRPSSISVCSSPPGGICDWTMTISGHWSGAIRVCYACFLAGRAIFMVTAYGKNRKENISAQEKKLYRKLLAQIENQLPKEW